MRNSIPAAIVVLFLTSSYSLKSAAGEAEVCFSADNTIEMLKCYTEEIAQREKTVDALYKQMMDIVQRDNTKIADSLRSSHESWLNYREKNCSFSGEVALTRRGFFSSYCHLRMLIEREKELKVVEPNIKRLFMGQ